MSAIGAVGEKKICLPAGRHQQQRSFYIPSCSSNPFLKFEISTSIKCLFCPTHLQTSPANLEAIMLSPEVACPCPSNKYDLPSTLIPNNTPLLRSFPISSSFKSGYHVIPGTSL